MDDARDHAAIRAGAPGREGHPANLDGQASPRHTHGATGAGGPHREGHPSSLDGQASPLDTHAAFAPEGQVPVSPEQAASADHGPVDAAAVRRLARGYGLHLDTPAARRLAAHVQGSRPALLDVLPLLRGRDLAELQAPDVELPATPKARISVRVRLDAIAPGAADLVRATAIAYTRQPLSVLAQVARLDRPLAALDEAVAAGLLVARRRGPDVLVAMRHPLERAAVLESLTLTRAAVLHRRLADTVADEGVSWSHRVHTLVGPDDAVADTLDSLADGYAAHGRWRHAAWAWLHAARLTPPRTDGLDEVVGIAGAADLDIGRARLVRSVDAFIGAGELDTAGGLLPELTAAGPHPVIDAVAGYRHTLLGQRAEADYLLTRAQGALSDDGAPVAGHVHHRLALHALLDWDGEGVIGHALAALAAGNGRSPAAIEAEMMVGLGLAAVGRCEEALAAYAAVTGGVAEAGMGAGPVGGALRQRGVMGSGWLHLALGDVVRAARELELSAPTEFWRGSTRISLWARAWLARAQVRLGQFAAALESVDDGLALAERTGQRFIEPLLHWSGAEAAALVGDDEEADRHVRRASGIRADYLVMIVPAVLARASVASVRGDAREVLRALEPLHEVERGPRGGRLDEPGFWPWRDLQARALVAVGDPEAALAVTSAPEEMARARGNDAAVARLVSVRALAVAARGETDAAVALFEEAVGLLDGAHDPLLRAQVLFDEGQVLSAAGRGGEAGVVLARARARFAAMGAWAAVRLCDEELRVFPVGMGLASTGADC